MHVEFEAPLWQHDGGWFFVTLPEELGRDIAEATAGVQRGFGSLRVTAGIDGVTWSTSIFPDSASGSFVLPIKKAVRQSAQLEAGREVTVDIVVLGV